MKMWKEIAYELENLDRVLVTSKKAKSLTEMHSGAQIDKAQQDYDEFVKTIPCFSHFTATEVGQLIVDARSFKKSKILTEQLPIKVLGKGKQGKRKKNVKMSVTAQKKIKKKR